MSDPQHIPTAMPSDTELLDALQATKAPGNLWVCHTSGYRDAFRLLELSPTEIRDSMDVLRPHTSVREALAVELGLVKKET